MNKKKSRFSIGAKMYIFVVLTIIAVAVGTAAIAYNLSADQIDRYYKNVSADNAQNFSTLVDPEYLMKLRLAAESDEYQQLRDKAEEEDNEDIIQQYLEEHGLWEGYCKTREKLIKYLHNMKDIKYLYIIVTGDKDAVVDMYLVDDDENPIYETGYYEEREQELLGMDLRGNTEPAVSNGDWGWLCSAYAPVKTSAGEYVCSIGCDFGMDDVMAERGRFFMYIIIGTLILTAILLAVSVLFINKTVVKPLDRLTAEMEKFDPDKHESYDKANVVSLDIKSHDEIKDIYDGIRSMQVKIIDYLNDLQALEEDKKKAENDIKDKEEQIGVISKAAYRDVLTGVGSKAAYVKKIEEINASLSDGHCSFALVMIDLNELKVINDTYGHKAGDMYIKGCCHIISEVFTASQIYRIGGDEFIAVLQDSDYKNRHELVTSLKERYRKTESMTEGEPWEKYSAAVGMAENASDDITIDLVFKRADKAMYEDKNRHKREIAEKQKNEE